MGIQALLYHGVPNGGGDGLDVDEAEAAVEGGKNYFVEMNLEMMKASVPYLRGLPV